MKDFIMHTPNLVIFYVENPQKSSRFYEQIFARSPVDFYPSWVSFTFENGLHFGLWSNKAINFISGGVGHRSEFSFMVANEKIVQDLYDKWKMLDIFIEQEIHQAVFGLTFVALDPDGHRIRVCVPGLPN